MQKHAMNLSKEETDEFIDCFTADYGSEENWKQIAISYIDRFIGKEMSVDLCERFQYILGTNVRFNALFINIDKRIHLLFYIKDYFRLITTDSVYQHLHRHRFYKTYNESAELSGYQIGYSYCDTYDLSGKCIHYIRFIVYKDNVVYIVNNYIPNKKFEISIEHTCHSAFINGRMTLCEYKFKRPGLSNKQLKDYLKAICVINELKDSD